MNKITHGSRVSLHYQLTLEDGTEIENSFHDEPLELNIGDGVLTEGMELSLFDQQAGDEFNIMLTPEQAYGFPDKENQHNIPLSDFPADLPPEEGLVIAFDGADNEEILGTVIEIKKQHVIVDFSHPLAGRNINFTVKILQVDGSDH